MMYLNLKIINICNLNLTIAILVIRPECCLLTEMPLQFLKIITLQRILPVRSYIINNKYIVL